MKSFFGLIVFTMILMVSIWLFAKSCSVANETASVVNQELGPRALNAKYEWFKDAHASLNSRKATIEMFSGKIKRLEKQYIDVPRNAWSRSDIDSLNQWESERDGTIAAYNNLAAEYNSEMSKFHTSFLNAGMLPAGGTLPREVAPYMKDSN